MSFTVPAELAGSIAQVADRLRVTRSALLSQLLTDPMAELVKIVDLLPADPRSLTREEAMRLRGDSAIAIRRVVTEAQEVASQLDGAPKLPL